MSKALRILIPLLIAAAAVGVGLVILQPEPAEPEGLPDPAAAAPSSTTPATSTTPPSTVDGETTTPSVTPEYTPTFEESSCAFNVPIGQAARCGWVTLPEDRANPTNGNTVRLHVAVMESPNPDAPADPLLYVGPGGPGGETLDTLAFGFDQLWVPFLTERDLVFFDQRGVGHSEPSLECPEEHSSFLESLGAGRPTAEDLEIELASLTACHDRLAAEGVDLSQYTSATAAADIADLRIALGFEDWNLLGISYATRLGLTVMRDHPEGVRSVILDSTYTPDVDLFRDLPDNVAGALDHFFGACESDSACAAAYPSLRNRAFDLVDALNTEPVAYLARDFLAGEQYPVVLDGDGFLRALFEGMYSEQIFPRLPELIAELERGETTIAALLSSNDITNAAFISGGLYYATQCNEEVVFATPDSVATGQAAHPDLAPLFPQTDGADPVFAICDVWSSGQQDPIENQPVSSDIPTLLLSGSFDPITPLSWAERAATTLDGSQIVEFPTLAHGASLAGACPTAVINSFLAAPLEPANTSCVADMAPVQFVPVAADPAAITLVAFDDEFLGVAISGVVPDGWERLAPGSWARSQDGLDQTAIVQQLVPAGIGADLVVELFAQQLGVEGGMQPAGETSAGTFDWELFVGAFDQFSVDVAIGTGGAVSGIVIMISSQDERDALIGAVFEPALEAYRAA